VQYVGDPKDATCLPTDLIRYANPDLIAIQVVGPYFRYGTRSRPELGNTVVKYYQDDIVDQASTFDKTITVEKAGSFGVIKAMRAFANRTWSKSIGRAARIWKSLRRKQNMTCPESFNLSIDNEAVKNARLEPIRENETLSRASSRTSLMQVG
jgi:hypothetical protein